MAPQPAVPVGVPARPVAAQQAGSRPGRSGRGLPATRWPGPAPAKGWAVPAAVLAGALGLAVFLPLGRTGIGWFLGCLTLVAGVAVRSGGPPPSNPAPSGGSAPAGRWPRWR